MLKLQIKLEQHRIRHEYGLIDFASKMNQSFCSNFPTEGRGYKLVAGYRTLPFDALLQLYRATADKL